jgi:hypothetical protein
MTPPASPIPAEVSPFLVTPPINWPLNVANNLLIIPPANFRDAALGYAGKGLEVFPAPETGEKKGIYSAEQTNGRNWGKTRDPVALGIYADAHPGANIGMPTGVENALAVLDIDFPTPGGHKSDGFASLEKLIADHGAPPLFDTTLEADTPTHGAHLVFEHPGPGFKVKSGPLKGYPGIDIQGDGRMILVAPSVKPGFGVYRWRNDLPIIPMPEWLKALVVEKIEPAPERAPKVKTERAPLPPLPPCAAVSDGPMEALLKAEFKRVVEAPDGERNAQLNTSALMLGKYVGAGQLNEDQAIERLMNACHASGLLEDDGEAQCRKTIASGMGKGRRDPVKGVHEMFGDAVAALPAGAGMPIVPPPGGAPLKQPGPPPFGPENKAAKPDLPPPPGAPTGDKAKPRYLFETVADLRSMPDQTWLVDRWIPVRSVGLIYGRFATGKSFIAFDLLLHLVYGMKEWHGIKLPGVECCGLLIAREGGTGFKRRIDAFKKHHSITDDTDRIVFMRSPVNFGEQVGFNEMKAAVETCGRKFKIVVVDTVGRALPGEDMFEPKSITRFMENLQQLGEISEGVAVGIHHENKAGEMMGSIYFDNTSDWMFHVERTGGAEDPLRQGKITCAKQKDGEDLWSRDVSYKFIETQPNGEGSLVVDTISAGPAGASKATKPPTDKEQLAFTALKAAIRTKGQTGFDIGGRSVTKGRLAGRMLPEQRDRERRSQATA